MARLDNVKVNWANVLAPSTQFEPAWEIQATFASEAQAQEFVNESKIVDPKAKGIKLKENDAGEKVYRFRRKVERADGNGENNPPLVCGPGGKDDPWDKLIGNGSVCNIQYAFLPYNNKFGKGVTVDLKGVQVIEHVAFGVQDGDEFDAADSPAAPSTSSSNEFDDDDF
jgi:hypothetical protein